MKSLLVSFVVLFVFIGLNTNAQSKKVESYTIEKFTYEGDLEFHYIWDDKYENSTLDEIIVWNKFFKDGGKAGESVDVIKASKITLKNDKTPKSNWESLNGKKVKITGSYKYSGRGEGQRKDLIQCTIEFIK